MRGTCAQMASLGTVFRESSGYLSKARRARNLKHGAKAYKILTFGVLWPQGSDESPLP